MIRKTLLFRVFFLSCILSMTVFLNSCATIFTGTSDVVSFTASVPGVKMHLDGRYKGELPLTLEISRYFLNGASFKVKFEKQNYQTQEFVLNREFNMIAVLDVTSIPTSGGIDVMTGALMKFSPTEYHVLMLEANQPIEQSSFQPDQNIYRYALTNFKNLQRDINIGSGEYLSSLSLAISELHGKNLSEASLLIKNSREELLAVDNAPEFAQLINNKFLVNL